MADGRIVSFFGNVCKESTIADNVCFFLELSFEIVNVYYRKAIGAQHS